MTIIHSLQSSLERAPKSVLTILAVVLVLLIGIFDFVTGLELHLTFFYLFPIALTSWYVNRRDGILIALLSAVAGFYSNYLAGIRQSSIYPIVWNVGMRAAVATLVAYALFELKSTLEKASDLASRDFLTGLPNGRAFYELAGREMARAFGLEPLTLACIDIEGFKWINHRFGYAVGDQMLCTIAYAIAQSVPRPELVGRIGGTSFAVLLPNAAPDGARFILERIQSKLRDERKRYAQPVTFFISAIACSKAPRSIAELMHQAEARMTRMKHDRRDTLEIDVIDSLPALN